MANWGYVAIDKTGKEIKGSRDADAQETLTRDLKQQGLIVLEVKQQNTLTRDINISFDKKPAARDLAVFCRQFASIVRAGVSIIEALNMLAEIPHGSPCRCGKGGELCRFHGKASQGISGAFDPDGESR